MIQEKYLIHQNNSKPCAFQITLKMAYSFHHVWIVKGFAIYDHWLISSSLSCQCYTNAILQGPLAGYHRAICGFRLVGITDEFIQ